MAQRPVVVLQARMGSSRLPGKALYPLVGRPIVAHCLERLLAADVGPVVLATTRLPADDALAALGRTLGVAVVRGDDQDVLGRFVQVLTAYPAPVVLRATADNPAVDPDAPARVLRTLEATAADYVSEIGLPCGAAVEAVRAGALLEADRQELAAYDREHVTTSIKRSPTRYRVRLIQAPRGVRRPELRLTVDTLADLDQMRRILVAAGAGRGIVPLRTIIEAADRVLASAEVA